MSRMKKYLIGFSVFVVLYAVIGFFVLPPVIRSVATGKLTEELHREVAIGGIKVNPFTLSIQVRDFTIKDRNSSQTFVSLGRVYLNFKLVSVFKRGLIFSEVKVESPYLRLVRNEDLTYNFSDLLGPREPEEKSKPLRFSLNNVQISRGSLDFLDRPKDTRHAVRDISIAIPFLSNFSYYLDTYVKPSFQGVVNGHPVSLTGETKPFKDSLETIFEVNIKDFDLPYYLAYVPFKMNFKVLSGFIDTKTRVSYRQYLNRPPYVNVSGKIALRTVKVVDSRDGPLFSLPLLELSLASTDLMLGRISLSAVTIQSPEIDLARDKQGAWNFIALLPPKSGKKEEISAGDRKGDGRKFTVNADIISMTDGKVSFSDHAADGFRTDLKNIGLKIDHFSTEEGRRAAVQAAFSTESDESFTAQGGFSIAPLAASGSLEVKGIALKKYSPYYRKNFLFDIERGQLEVMTKYEFAMHEQEPAMLLSGLSAVLSSLRMKKRDEKEDFLNIPVVAIKGTDIDTAKKEITVGELSTQKGTLHIKRLQGGGLNVASLATPSKGTGGKTSNPEGKGKEKPWSITLKKVEASRYTVKMEDLTTQEPVSFSAEGIKLAGEDISTVRNRRGKASLAFHVGKKGTFSSSGTVVIDPAALILRVNARDFDITPVQPYFTDRVKILVTGGSFTSKGTLTLGYKKETGAKAGYKGDALLAHFASVDKANAEDFLKWDSLYVKGIDAGYNPLRVRIDEIALADFYSRVIVNADGALNLQDIMEEGGGKEGGGGEEKPTGVEAGKEPAAKQIKIDRVTLQGGTINFSDKHITPNYFANLKEIGGRISGLSSEEDKFADVDLRGKLEDYAPLEITGKINPLREDLFVDLKVDFKDMDMSSLNPYAGRYVGYEIQKGQLSLNLQYLIVKKKLDSKNNIVFDQLSLGDRVDSPDATKLPVKLAIALLKNRKGEINLDVPVSGYIDDPKFRLGKVILKVLVNILVKAATSPFSLLGALFGGGEELGFVQFDYGSFALDEGARKKLDTLIKALTERPALKLEIKGYVDTEKDREGLRQYLFNKKVKAQKLRETLKKGAAPVPVDEINIEKNEYPKYLKEAYKAEKFPKPRNFLGIAKSLPVPEMEKLMLTNIVVSDDDLKRLASERALKVKEYLLKSQAVGPERIFLSKPGTLRPEKKEKLRDSRVDFTLE
jgi:uncharacterized protein involved in outer membrane biogenesis